MRKPILFVNVTRQCNVDCPRCYLSKEVRSQKDLIPFEYIEKALNDPFYNGPDIEPVLAWEGGELTLVGEHILRDYMNRVREKFPNVRQTMVTNALNVPNWVIELCKEFMDGHFEVTYASGHKYTLDGSSEKYQDKFKRSIKKAKDAGLSVAVNVELNIETYNDGPAALVQVMRETGVKIWEFDVSVRFDDFLADPQYNHCDYPVLPGTMTFDMFSQYIIDLVKNHDHDLQELGIQSSILWHSQTLNEAQFFDVKNSNEMFSLNPDGTVFLNVLWSDMKEMFLGNIQTKEISDFLRHPVRRKHIRWEVMERAKSCTTCEYYSSCNGGPSHAPLYDGVSSECSGGKMIYDFMRKEYKGVYDSNQHMIDPIQGDIVNFSKD